jgi:hypothetical protein
LEGDKSGQKIGDNPHIEETRVNVEVTDSRVGIIDEESSPHKLKNTNIILFQQYV